MFQYQKRNLQYREIIEPARSEEVCSSEQKRTKIPRKRMLRTMTHFPSYLFSLPSTPTHHFPTPPALYHRLRGYQDHWWQDSWCQDRGTSPSTKSSARYARRSLLSSSCRGLLTQALGCDCDCGCWETGIWELLYYLWILLFPGNLFNEHLYSISCYSLSGEGLWELLEFNSGL